jgi:Fibronectin type III domain/Peptidase_C39 like family
MKSSTPRKISRGFIALVLLLSLLGPVVFAQGGAPATTPARSTEYFSVETLVMDDGRVVDKTVISGPPTPPEGYERPIVEPGTLNKSDSVVILTTPAYNWSFGCSATTAAMIAAYYDRGSYPNMYTGPTDGGVMPMDNSVWPDWVDGAGDTRHQCPLSATHNGLDGRATRGNVDDYWVEYGDPGPDPYVINGWPEHTLSDCTGDFMKTNRANSGNSDGGTTFYFNTDGSPLYAAAMEAGGIDDVDGGYGVKLFYESRGYVVTAMYNQYVKGHGSNPNLGFTFAQYMAEIDAGRPVMFHVEGHTMIGVGYDSASNLMYIHDTWDYSTHTMTWDGMYSGMQHYGITIVHLQAAALPPNAPSNLTATAISQHQINLAWTDNSTNESGFKIERSPFAPGSWTQIATVGAGVQTYPNTGLASGTTYYYRVRAWNAAGDSGYSNEAHATTSSGTTHRAYLPLVFKNFVTGGGTVVVLWNQPLSTVNQNAYVDQDFPDYPNYSSYLADDFVNAAAWNISTIFVPGDGWNGFSSLFNATALTWQIYADCAGVPCGNPSGGSSPVWTLTLPPTDPKVTITTGTPGGYPSNTTLTLPTPVNRPAGHWWLVFYPTMSYGSYGQFGRQSSDTANGYTGQFINPGGDFGYGTAWQAWTVLGSTQQDIAFRLEGY